MGLSPLFQISKPREYRFDKNKKLPTSRLSPILQISKPCEYRFDKNKSNSTTSRLGGSKIGSMSSMYNAHFSRLKVL
jgi:hypothetical protein